jgi:hypothetical protein
MLAARSCLQSDNQLAFYHHHHNNNNNCISMDHGGHAGHMMKCKMNMLWYTQSSSFFIPGIETSPGTQTSSTPVSSFEAGTFPLFRSSLDHVSLSSFSASSTSISAYFSERWTIMSPYRCKLRGKGNPGQAVEGILLQILKTLVF